MKPIIVADTGPLIALAKLHHLDLLNQLFEKIHIPRTVYQEATRNHQREDAGLIAKFSEKHINIWQDIHNPFSHHLTDLLDQGEIQALTLAQQLGCGVLMDERRGRQVAHHYHISVVGTLGLLLQAKNQKQLSTIKPLIEKLQIEGYRFSPELVEYTLTKAKE